MLYDSWTGDATNFVGTFALYCRTVDVVRDVQLKKESVVACPLLSVSPMEKLSALDDEETTYFSSKVHAHHFREIFDIYNVSLQSWLVCQVADNCAVNKKIAQILKVPHVGCCSHKLHLEATRMVDNNFTLLSVLNVIEKVMTECKSKLKNRSLLRNLSTLSLVLPKETRWSGLYRMLSRFNELRTTLIKISETEGFTLSVDKLTVFKNKALRFENMLTDINDATTALQQRKLTLSDCRLVLDSFFEHVSTNKDVDGSNLEDCQLGNHCIAGTAPILLNLSFESGVVKIQRGRKNNLTSDEIQACKGLRFTPSGDYPPDTGKVLSRSFLLGSDIKTREED